ncbi:caspase family protein [Bradyrhizobium sp. RT10b]|uniref:nSTAND1 domain-containing NTPase n=1 Tax=Bradyrhizobium sp. RT10b TaxID=3156331 RepID=UPI003397F597
MKVPAGFGSSIAVVVGIDSYENVPPLRTPVNDAVTLAGVLRDKHGFSTKILINERATRDELRRTLEDLSATVGNNDRVLFYFAGHGIALDSDQGPRGYILPQDAERTSTDKYLSMVDLSSALSALPCRHMLVILDCCFAGAFRWSSPRDIVLAPESLHRERYSWYIRDPAWQAIASAAHDQKALDVVIGEALGVRGRVANHSPFAAALIDGLEGQADLPRTDGIRDGVITATELFLYIEERLMPPPGSGHPRQTPLLWPLAKHDKGQFVFLTPGHELDLPPAPHLDRQANPWRGLEVYEPTHKDLFFGRGRVSERLAQLVLREKLVVVTGSSGIGKSSLVGAGLVPLLPSTFKPVTVRPGGNPFVSLRAALSEAAIPSKAGDNTSDPFAAIDEWTRAQGCELLLIVDQAEELITVTRDARLATAFLSEIAARVAGGTSFRCLLTVRSDIEPQFLQSALKDRWNRGRFLVPQMSYEELRRVIEGPAARNVVRFESPDLVDTLVNEVLGMPGGLPLLSFALSQMYRSYLDRRAADRTLAYVDYAALGGGVIGSLRYGANRVLAAHSVSTARRVLERFVSPGPGDFTRRKVDRSEFVTNDPKVNGENEKLIVRLIEERLVVTTGLYAVSGDSSQINRYDPGSAAYLELAHDALIPSWDQLHDWVSEDTATTFELRRLTSDAMDWSSTGGKSVSDLWDSPNQIQTLRKLGRNPRISLSRVESRFVERSSRRYTVRRSVGYLSAAAIAILFVAPAYVWLNYFRVTTTYCSDFTLKWEEPECLSELSEAGFKGKSITFRITRKGRNVTEFAQVDSVDRPTTTRLNAYDRNGTWLDETAVVRYESRDANNRVNRAIYLDERGKPIRRVAYDYESNDVAIAVFSESLGISYSQSSDVSALSKTSGETHRAGIGQHRLQFNEAGHLVRRTFHPLGSLDPLRDGVGSFGQAYDHDAIGRTILVTNLDSRSQPLRDRTGALALQRIFGPSGALMELKWLGAQGKPAVNSFGISAVRLTRDGSGNISEFRFLNSEGKVVPRKDSNVAILKREIDANGNVSTEQSFDAAEAAVIDKRTGISLTLAAFDEKGRTVRKTYFDAQGKRTLNKENGISGAEWGWDSSGNNTYLSYFAVDDKPTVNKKTGISTRRSTFDAAQQEIEQAYFDADGRPTLDRDKLAARVVITYDSRGNEVAGETFGVNGEPILRKEGFAKHVAKFDRRNNKIEDQYFDENGKPTIRNDRGFSSVRFTYDERGNASSVSYYGVDRRAVIDGLRGAASVRWEYDDAGNRVSEEFFGPAGQPLIIKDFGYAKATFVFDERGNRTAEYFFGPTGERTFSLLDGASGVLKKYDDGGNTVEERYVGADDKPMVGRFGYARRTSRFDDRGNEIELGYFGIDDEPVLDVELAASKIRTKFDTRDNMVEASYYDEKGAPVIRKDKGYFKVVSTYDERGWNVGQAFFGLKGEPIAERTSGAARFIWLADDRGNTIEEQIYAPDGSPALRSDDGAFITRNGYDSSDRNIEQSYFGADGRPIRTTDEQIARITTLFDDRGNEIEERFFDVDGTPMKGARGYAFSKSRFDGRGNRIEERYYDEKGRPAIRTDKGIAVWLTRFNQFGMETENSYLGLDDRPIADLKFGAARVVSEYDEYDRQIGQAYFGADGLPTLWKGTGIASWTSRLNQAGKTVEEQYFGTDGKPTVDLEKGIASAKYSYDDASNQIAGQYFDVSGNPAARKDKGYASFEARFNVRGDKIGESYRDALGSPVLASDTKIARLTRSYDARGNLLEEAYFNEVGQPTMNASTDAATIRRKWDSSGRLIEIAYFGIDEKPILGDEGYAKRKIEYDKGGRKSRDTLFGEDGTPLK